MTRAKPRKHLGLHARPDWLSNSELKEKAISGLTLSRTKNAEFFCTFLQDSDKSSPYRIKNSPKQKVIDRRAILPPLNLDSAQTYIQ